MDEKEWIKRIVAGDTQMFSCLVAKYERMAYTIAFRILGNKEEAEEATQDAFVRMYRALPRFQFESKFSTWFYRIVYRVPSRRPKPLPLTSVIPPLSCFRTANGKRSYESYWPRCVPTSR